jgi:transcriptional regulator with XRE-family HTH domain
VKLLSFVPMTELTIIGTFILSRGDSIVTIGNRIKMIRKTNKVNQATFSNQIGISQATLSELEQDKYQPSVDTIMALFTHFGVNIEWLLFGVTNESLGDDGRIFHVHNISKIEGDLLSEFRKLKVKDQEEIIDFIRLKITRYGS